MRTLTHKRIAFIATAAVFSLLACALVSLIFGGGNAGYAPLDMALMSATSSAPFPTNVAYAATASPAPTMVAAAAEAGGANAAYRQAANGTGSIDQAQQVEPGRRIVIRSATINITVEDTVARVNEIGSMAEGFGGWIVTSSTSVSGGTPDHPNVYGNITIRVPAESFDAAMVSIRELAVVVNNEQITGQDVTQDYVDTASRLRNLETAEQQLQTIMAGATTVGEVLSVYDQLVSTRSEIEVARGRLQYYDEAASFSAIVITLNPNIPTPTPAPPPVTYGWNPMVTVTRSLDGLVRFAQNALDTLIAIAIYLLPVALVLGLPASMLWRQFQRRRRTKRQAPVQPTPTVSDTDTTSS
ncbi:MAG: DUF4349 domain-containing protein [Anaerolineae bacterium]